MSNKHIYLVDGSGYIFRAFHGIRPLSKRDGTPTNAVYGVARMLLRLLDDNNPSHISICFDAKRKTFRHDIYPDYKANREEVPEALIPQFPLIRELVAAFGLHIWEKEGYEADDLIGTLADSYAKQGYLVTVVSGDKDLTQLLNEKIALYDPMKDRWYKHDQKIDRLDVFPSQVVDYLALTGDASDNIPGVPRVGSKTAAKLLHQFENLENILKSLDEITPPSVQKSLSENKDKAELSYQLAMINRHVPDMPPLQELTYQGLNKETLFPVLESLEFNSLLKELDTGNDYQTAAHSVEVAPKAVYTTISQQQAFDELLTACEKEGTFSVDLETTSLQTHQANIVGIAISVKEGQGYYIPITHHYLGVPEQLPKQMVLDKLQPLIESTKIGKIGQNLKYDSQVFRTAGLRMAGITEDTMLASYVLNPERNSHGMDNLAKEILNYDTIKYSEVAGKGNKQISFDQVPVEIATPYAAEDAEITLRLAHYFQPRLLQQKMDTLYRDIELPLLNVLADMEYTGIRVDTAKLRELDIEISKKLIEVEKKAGAIAGEDVNIGSTKQLAYLLFEKFGLPTQKKTKTGYSTDQSVLEALVEYHDLPKIVLEYRQLTKLRSTYIEALLGLADSNQRVHTSFNQTRTATGRLSSSDPNLQNIPVRSEWGTRIRQTFAAQSGCILLAADYSQIELRMLAHLSKDQAFIDAFKRGQDIHSRTAQELLADEQGNITKDMRRHAKAINFGIVYGQSAFRLGQDLGISTGEAKDYLEQYFSRYPGIQDYIKTTIKRAQANGWVTTIAGRKRFVPDINSANKNIRAQAERIAVNTTIQGSAADLIKIAMIKLHKALEDNSLQSKLILQVHDELVLEIVQGEQDVVKEITRKCMEEVMELAVPLEADIGVGENWAQAH